MGRPALYPVQEFNGLKFYRKPAGYYKADHKIGGQYMHRYVWECHFGPIPLKTHIHHKNGIKDDNRIENLEAISASEHTSHHGRERRPKGSAIAKRYMAKLRIKASLWHKSRAGRSWHRRHAKEVARRLPMEEHICIWCKNPYKVKKGARKIGLCGPNCQARYRYHSGVDNIERSCRVCKKKFTCNKYNKTRFCSLKCSASRRKHHGRYGKQWRT